MNDYEAQQAAYFDAVKLVEKITSNVKSDQKFGLQIIKPKEEVVEVKKHEKNISLAANEMMQFDQFILKEENKNFTLSEVDKIFLEEQKRFFLLEKLYKHSYNYNYNAVIDPNLI